MRAAAEPTFVHRTCTFRLRRHDFPVLVAPPEEKFSGVLPESLRRSSQPPMETHLGAPPEPRATRWLRASPKKWSWAAARKPGGRDFSRIGLVGLGRGALPGLLPRLLVFLPGSADAPSPPVVQYTAQQQGPQPSDNIAAGPQPSVPKRNTVCHPTPVRPRAHPRLGEPPTTR